jgi:hypothetical protein
MRRAAVVALLIAMAPGAVLAQKDPPKRPKVEEVTNEDLRKHAEKFFAVPKNATRLEDLRKFLILTIKDLQWKKLGDGYTAVWKSEVKKGVKKPQREKAHADLKKLVYDMVTWESDTFADVSKAKVAFDGDLFGGDPDEPPPPPKKPKVETITTAELKNQAEKFFADKKNAAKLEGFADLFDLGPDTLTWKKDGDSYTAAWNVKVKKGAKPTEAQKADLKKFFGEMARFEGGFFEPAAEAKVAFDIGFVGGDEDLPPPPKKKPVKDVTSADLRKHVDKFFADKKNAAKVEAFTDLFEFNLDDLTWKKKGDRYVAEWRLKVKKGVNLTKAEKDRAAVELKKWFNEVVTFDGGFFQGDGEMVGFDIGFEDGGPVKPPKRTWKDVSTADLKTHAEKYFSDRTRLERVRQFVNLFDTGLDNLTWMKDGDRITAIWRLRTKKGVRMLKGETDRIEAEFKKVVRDVIDSYMENVEGPKGNLQLDVTIQQQDDGGPRRDPPVLPPPATPPSRTGQRYHIWYWMPSYCGCGYGGGYWTYGGLYTVPATAAPASAAAPAPARSGPALPPPRPARTGAAAADSSNVERIAASSELPPSTPRRPAQRRTTLDIRGMTALAAPDLYWRGYALYWDGEYAAAWKYFEAATRLADDARYWYYRALTERVLGDDGRESLQRGADLERQGKPHGEQVGLALERIQGPVRTWLRSVDQTAQPGSTSRSAERVVGR